MTKRQILKRLVDIAAIKNSASGSEFICCDMLYQETLFDVQEALSLLMSDIANLDGYKSQSMLARELPHVFGVTNLPEAK